MITFDYIYKNKNYWRAAILDAEGDTLYIKTEWPVLGVVSLKSFEVNSEGAPLEVHFRYSKDSLTWSDYMPLSAYNLSMIKDLKCNHTFSIEYKVIATENSYTLLYWIDVYFDYKEQPSPAGYEELEFSRFFPFKYRQGLIWAANVLNKIFYKGIVARYIERYRNDGWADEDYINLWWTIIYFLSFRVSFSNALREVAYRPELLREYLIQRHLNVGDEKDLARYYYLATYYLNEIRRRGTGYIFNEKLWLPSEFYKYDKNEYLNYNYINYSRIDNAALGLGDFTGIDIQNPIENASIKLQFLLHEKGDSVRIDGEMLRLIDNEDRDHEHYVLTKDDIGWYVNNSSPFYESPSTSSTFTRAYSPKNRQYFLKGDIPVLAPPTIFVPDFESVWPQYYEINTLPAPPKNSNIPYRNWSADNPKSEVYAKQINSAFEMGIGGDSKEGIVWINPRFSYEISFYVTQSIVGDFSFGVKCFNRYGVETNITLHSNKNIASTTFLERITLPNLYKIQNTNNGGDYYYHIRGIIFAPTYTGGSDVLNIGTGNNLRFIPGLEETVGIIPQISLKNVDGGTGKYLRIVGLTIGPAKITTAEYLSQDNVFWLRYKASKRVSLKEASAFIDRNLIPYNMELNSGIEDEFTRVLPVYWSVAYTRPCTFTCASQKIVTVDDIVVPAGALWSHISQADADEKAKQYALNICDFYAKNPILCAPVVFTTTTTAAPVTSTTTAFPNCCVKEIYLTFTSTDLTKICAQTITNAAIVNANLVFTVNQFRVTSEITGKISTLPAATWTGNLTTVYRKAVPDFTCQDAARVTIEVVGSWTYPGTNGSWSINKNGIDLRMTCPSTGQALTLEIDNCTCSQNCLTTTTSTTPRPSGCVKRFRYVWGPNSCWNYIASLGCTTSNIQLTPELAFVASFSNGSKTVSIPFADLGVNKSIDLNKYITYQEGASVNIYVGGTWRCGNSLGRWEAKYVNRANIQVLCTQPLPEHVVDIECNCLQECNATTTTATPCQTYRITFSDPNGCSLGTLPADFNICAGQTFVFPPLPPAPTGKTAIAWAEYQIKNQYYPGETSNPVTRNMSLISDCSDSNGNGGTGSEQQCLKVPRVIVPSFGALRNAINGSGCADKSLTTVTLTTIRVTAGSHVVNYPSATFGIASYYEVPINSNFNYTEGSSVAVTIAGTWTCGTATGPVSASLAATNLRTQCATPATTILMLLDGNCTGSNCTSTTAAPGVTPAPNTGVIRFEADCWACNGGAAKDLTGYVFDFNMTNQTTGAINTVRSAGASYSLTRPVGQTLFFHNDVNSNGAISNVTCRQNLSDGTYQLTTSPIDFVPEQITVTSTTQVVKVRTRTGCPAAATTTTTTTTTTLSPTLNFYVQVSTALMTNVKVEVRRRIQPSYNYVTVHSYAQPPGSNPLTKAIERGQEYLCYVDAGMNITAADFPNGGCSITAIAGGVGANWIQFTFTVTQAASCQYVGLVIR